MLTSPPDRPRLRERYNQRQEEVIGRAAQVIAKQGFHNTSVGDLVEATGLQSGGLYYYIGSKDKLLSMIYLTLIQQLIDDVQPIVEEPGPPVERFRRFMLAWLSRQRLMLDHSKVIMAERIAVRQGPYADEVAVLRTEFERLVNTMLREVADVGMLRVSDPRDAFGAVYGMVIWSGQRVEPADYDAERLAATYCELLLADQPRAPSS